MAKCHYSDNPFVIYPTNDSLRANQKGSQLNRGIGARPGAVAVASRRRVVLARRKKTDHKVGFFRILVPEGDSNLVLKGL